EDGIRDLTVTGVQTCALPISEGDNVTWIGGYWAWDPDRNDYLWVSGIYRDNPPGMRWVAGYWERTDDGWRWVAGMWVPAQTEQRSEERRVGREWETGGRRKRV